MLFNTLAFWIFFGLVFAIYRATPERRNLTLLVASYVFYSAWDWRLVPLLFFSSLVDFLVGKKLSVKKSRMVLSLSVLANLGLLGTFKYFDFFVDGLRQLFAMDSSWMAIEILLPIGISFYTFQSMAYTIDIYRGKQQAVQSPLQFFLFVSYFPQLIAGPIERGSKLLPQIVQPAQLTLKYLQSGFELIAWGLLKKMLIADSLGVHVDRVFHASGNFSSLEYLVAGYAFALQIYCDFSGYTSIARGISKCFGIELSENFKFPFFSKTPKEFWQRWHITLSEWLRDYLYIPLGGGQGGSVAVIRNVMITMALGGLWHGANWTFVIWGIFHGALVLVYRFCKFNFHPFMMRLVLFHLVCFGFMIFRAEDFSHVSRISESLLSFTENSSINVELIRALLVFGLPLLVVESIMFARGMKLPLDNLSSQLRWTGSLGLIVLTVFLGRPGGELFIYFQF